MERNIVVTKIGKDGPSDSMRYRVEVTGQDQRTFEVRVPLTAVVSKPDLEEEIKKLFTKGWLPEHGTVHLLGAIGW
jgi:hypothetical protein